MARYTIHEDYIDVIGVIWMPATTGATRYSLSAYDVVSIGKLTRDNVAHWLMSHSGDFQRVADFHASIDEWESEWEYKESEYTYTACMYPSED
jgi:hypothetical protein